MPVTANKGYSVPTPGTEVGTWGTDLNANSFGVIDLNLGGTVYIPVTNANVTLTALQAQNGIIRIGGVMTGHLTVTIPYAGIYAVRNETVAPYIVWVAGPLGNKHIVPQGMSSIVHVDTAIGAFIAGQRSTTVGMIAPFCGVNAPPGWQFCDGSLLPRADFSDLWTYAQNCGNMATDANWFGSGLWGTFSSGDGVTNFRVPDLRGWFLRCWPNTAVAHDAGRVCATGQTDGIANHTHPASSSVTDPGHVHGLRGIKNNGQSIPVNTGGTDGYGTTNVNTATTGITVGTTVSNNNGGIAETRPTNISLMYCVSLS